MSNNPEFIELTQIALVEEAYKDFMEDLTREIDLEIFKRITDDTGEEIKETNHADE